MAWLSRACKFLCLQRVSLLLNLLFFLHLMLLYHREALVRQVGNDVGEQETETGATVDAGKKPTASENTRHVSADTEFNKWSSKPAKSKTEKPTPIIYLITPTFARSARKADFTRLAQTVRQVPNLHWIVVEDGPQLHGSVANVLRRLITNYTYLAAPTPTYKKLALERNLNKGIFQRNVALEWIRWQHKDSKGGKPGVIYFADDDNTYDLRLFEIMRSIRLMGVWPVALVGGVKLEKPRMNKTTGQLITFEVGFAPNRTFAVDMAGFALGLGLVLSKPKGHFPLDTVRGWNEPALLDALDLSYEDVQVLGLDIKTPDGLLEPLVWHTKTADVNLGEENRFRKLYGYKTSDEGWQV